MVLNVYGFHNLKQIDPTIQSISKFQDAYKTIEISNLNNIQVECGPPEIENFIPNRNVNLNGGGSTCDYDFGSLENITLQEGGRSQTDKINFPNTFTIKDTKEITNEIKTFTTAYTNGLPSHNDYENRYKTKNSGYIKFLLQITKLYNNDKDEIKETFLQAYYTNDLKLKIRFSKILLSKLVVNCKCKCSTFYMNENLIFKLNS